MLHRRIGAKGPSVQNVVLILTSVLAVAQVGPSVLEPNIYQGLLLQEEGITRSQEKGAPERLGDGCHHVFLDAGANIGIHTRFLFEPLHYPNATTALAAFREAFGPPELRDSRDFCAFGFEPNPAHRARHMELQNAYQKMGWRYVPILAGLGDADGNMTFYHDPSDQKNSEWGFSVVNRRPGARPEHVPIIHFSKWIEYHILERQLPEKVYGTYVNQQQKAQQTQEEISNKGTSIVASPHPGRVALKLDIEGMEFIVAPSMIFSGVMCKAIDVAFGEYHAAGHIPVRKAMDEFGRGEVAKFKNWIEAKQHFFALWKAMQSVSPTDCKARWLDLPDVEAYLHDGVPFPSKE